MVGADVEFGAKCLMSVFIEAVSSYIQLNMFLCVVLITWLI